MQRHYKQDHTAKHMINPIVKACTQLGPSKQLIILICLSLALGSASLNRGLQSDDFIHQHHLSKPNIDFYGKINGLFFFLEDPNTRPWWFHPQLKIEYWRPISALSHIADYQWWPESSLLMHLHSMIWYCLAVILSFIFFKRLLKNENLAFLASLLFGLDFSHFANLSWLANRNSLIACCFVLIGFTHYLRWTEEKKNTGSLIIALASYCLALLSSESSLALALAIPVFDILQKQNKKIERRKFLAWACFLGASFAWYIYYQSQGFGTAYTSFYTNPLTDTGTAIHQFFTKTPVYLFTLLTGIEGFYNPLHPQLKLLISVSALAFLGVFFIAFREFFEKDKTKYLLLTAIIFLALPTLASPVDMRFTLLASIFSSASLALFLNFNFHKTNKNWLVFITLLLTIGFHMIAQGAQWLIVGTNDLKPKKHPYETLANLKNNHPGQDIYLLNYPKPIDSYYINTLTDGKKEGKIIILSNQLSAHSFEFIDSTTLELKSKQGFAFTQKDFYQHRHGQLIHKNHSLIANNQMLPREFKFQEGDEIENDLLRIKILLTNPKGLVSKFKVELKSQNPVVIFWRGD